MRQLKIHVNFSRLFFAWVLVVASGIGFSELTGAIEERANSDVIEFNPPDRQAPSTGVGGMPRCGYKVQLSALVPRTDNSSYFGLTVTDRPILYFYNRDINGQNDVYFELSEQNTESSDNSEKIFHETIFNVPKIVGIMGVSLPPEVKLEPGKTYRWYIESSTQLEPQGMAGLIERLETSPELATQLASAKTAIDRARIYAEAGIWYDAIDTLTRERQGADTPELKAQWESLLASLDLSEEIFDQLVEAPFVEVESITDN